MIALLWLISETFNRFKLKNYKKKYCNVFSFWHQALATLASQLIDLIKQPGIALGTKGATVHVITTLTHQCPLDLQQVIF
jgi:hypothetical protein